MATLADIQMRYSGGAGNSDPLASLGGVMSANVKPSQNAAGISNVTGVTVTYAALNAVGQGSLQFTHATTELTWTPFAGAAGPAVDVSADGSYALLGSAGYLVVTVVSASLPGSDQSDVVTITNVTEGLYPNITGGQATTGLVTYACEYVTNIHGADTINNARLYIGQQPVGADDLAIGLDPAGIGNGSTTGVATTIATATDVPAGVVFSAPSDLGSALLIGSLPFGNGAAFWLRRTVPSNVVVPTPQDASSIIVAVEL